MWTPHLKWAPLSSTNTKRTPFSFFFFFFCWTETKHKPNRLISPNEHLLFFFSLFPVANEAKNTPSFFQIRHTTYVYYHLTCFTTLHRFVNDKYYSLIHSFTASNLPQVNETKLYHKFPKPPPRLPYDY